MRVRKIMLACAGGAACISGALVYAAIPCCAPATVEVLVAARALSAGHRLGKGDIAWQAWPAASRPAYATVRGPGLQPATAMLAKRTPRAFLAGEPLNLEAGSASPAGGGTGAGPGAAPRFVRFGLASGDRHHAR